MRPLELRLRNFRSFHGEGHTFDFRDRRLIGVVGPIGSGKSTILDAIAFALYGRTPRIGHATKSLIHQRALHAAVALRFEIEGEVWEAVRQLRRTGPSQHALYLLPGDEPDHDPVEKVLLERKVNDRIEQLLGLDYHGFGRSVLLAQGQFAQFLSARPAERDKVLKGVFGYERIDTVRAIARDRAAKGEAEIDKLSIRIEHAEAAKARLDERGEELAEADHRLDTLKAARPVLNQITERMAKAAESRKQAENRLLELGQHTRELPDPVAGEQVLAMAERARARLDGAEYELQVTSDSLAEAEAVLASEEFEKLEGRLKDAADLVLRLEAGRDRIETRLGELRAATGELPDRIKGIQAVAMAEYAWARRVEAMRDLDAVSNRLAAAEATVASDVFIERERRLKKATGLVIQLEARREAADRSSEEVVRAGSAVENDERSEDRARSARASALSELEAAAAAAREAASQLSEAESRLHDARHADMAGFLRDQLTDGDTCPVCEQPVIQVPTGVGGDTAAAQAGVDQARFEREDTENRLRRTMGTAEATKAELVAADRRLAESRLRLAQNLEVEKQQNIQLDVCRDELGNLIGEGDPAIRVEEEGAALDSFRTAVENARTVREEKRAALDDATDDERRAQTTLSNLRTRIGALAILLQAEFEVPEGDPDAMRAALASLHTQWNRTTIRLESALEEERAGLQAASAQLAKQRAAADSFRAAVEEARAVREKARAALDDAIAFGQQAQRALSDLRTRIGALAVLLQAEFEVPEGEPDAVRAALASLHTEWNRATARLGSGAREQRSRAEAASARLEKEQANYGIEGSIESALAEVRAKREQIDAEIKREERLVAGVVDLLQERRKRKDEVRLNRRLVRDLTDSRFIRFLLDEERAVLAGLGSEHFERLSSGRYRFTEDGNFHIVDLTSADAIRRADSLSGGETFLASLGLALGLAEMVGRRGGRLDAFFLDEGFGTLDPEHLDLAMEGIESLVADREQRLVVVVSHVPELRQRIEDLIVLDKDVVTGDSIVKGGGQS